MLLQNKQNKKILFLGKPPQVPCNISLHLNKKCVCVYIYIYRERERERESASQFHFWKWVYDALRFTQIKVSESIASLKREDNLLFWQMIKLLTVAALIY